MRRVLFFLSLLSASRAPAEEAFLKQRSLAATATARLPTTPDDAEWGKVRGMPVRATVQRSVVLHDRKANAVATKPSVLELTVKILSTGSQLAVWVEWPDATRDVIREDEANVYADTLTLQVPAQYGPGLRLPAISMGDEKMAVKLSMLRATRNGALESDLLARGFGSSTRQAPARPNPTSLQYDEAKKRWRAVFTLAVPEAASLVPFALAVWDGGRLERSGYKRLSSWHFIVRSNRVPDPGYVKALSWGHAPGELGDVAQGKVLATALCSSCHHLPGATMAPAGIAPSLLDAGAYHLPSYLRASMEKPGEVVLFEPNPNQHYAPTEPRDKNGAAPNVDAFRWASVGPDGQRISKMPSFGHLAPEQISGIVAYLMTLDGTEEVSK